MQAEDTSPKPVCPPRIEPLPRDEWAALLPTLPYPLPGQEDQPLNIFTVLARHPELFRHWVGFAGLLLFCGRLPPRTRELAILRTAHLSSCSYEWEHHAPIAQKTGISLQAIAAISRSQPGAPLSPPDRLIIAATDELHRTGDLRDDTWAKLRALHDEPQLIELVLLIGQYKMLATALRTLRVPLEE
ncbi:carboxymuconolactone decarboxylase family protein [Streptomyces sp. NPDC006879]|uniref:carboxymuconolactone decarboxylase family protein n=1 Tax=Streptomyces sp. NPDC006879 TaxID=3364767 RepID=UPI00368FE852